MSDVFLSHSSKDKEYINKVCEYLESQGLKCWIAPRNIISGTDWAASISMAIAECKVFLLFYSENSSQSEQVARELSLAESKKNVKVIPYKMDDTPLTGSFEYYLNVAHWIVANPKKNQYNFEELYHQISLVTSQNINITNNMHIDELHIHNGENTAPTSPANTMNFVKNQKFIIITVCAVVIVGMAIIGGSSGKKSSPSPDDSVIVAENSSVVDSSSIPETEEETEKEIPNGTRIYLDIDTVKLTENELKEMNYTVPLNVVLRKNAGITACEWGISCDKRCTMETYYTSQDYTMISHVNEDKSFAWVAWASENTYTFETTMLKIFLTLPKDASAGDFYAVNYADVSLDESVKHSWKDAANQIDYIALEAVAWDEGGVQITDENGNFVAKEVETEPQKETELQNSEIITIENYSLNSKYTGTYTGEVNTDGIPSGNGDFTSSYTDSNGDTYAIVIKNGEGTFTNGIYEGNVQEMMTSSESGQGYWKYTGGYKDSNWNGEGKYEYTFPEDNVDCKISFLQEGIFENGVLNGKGKSITNYSEEQEYGIKSSTDEGIFTNGALNGQGETTIINWDDSVSVYEGEFSNGNWEGKATAVVKYVDGSSSIRKGVWENNAFISGTTTYYDKDENVTQITTHENGEIVQTETF